MNFRVAALSVTSAALLAAANARFPKNIVVPSSSVFRASDAGKRYHTHVLINADPSPIWSDPVPMASASSHGPSLFRMLSGPAGFHPQDVRNAYSVSGYGSGAIAIIDAYNFPTALSDFNTFSAEFGLPQETSTNPTASTNKVFQVVYASGTQPANNAGWNVEEALDIEWAHSMAPSAKIYLVEANSSFGTDLYPAVQVGASLPGVTQQSHSWGSGEFSGEAAADSYFNNSNVAYFVSSGDDAVQEYPSESPKVTAVGGTSLYLNSNGTYGHEAGWSGSGGGPSAYEPRPSFQNGISGIVGSVRGAPDISAIADPNTGVAIYDTGYGGWFVVGGTSLACPVCAGIANQQGMKLGSTEQAWIYANTSDFRDVTLGGTKHYRCTAGWDFVTGWGSPLGFIAKTATVGPDGAFIYNNLGTGATGSYANLDAADQSYYTITSVPTSSGQTAAAEIQFAIPSGDLSGLQNVVFNLYNNGPATVTDFIYLKNLSTGNFDLVASPSLTGADAQYTFSLNSSNTNFTNYINLTTGSVTMLERAVQPTRFGSTSYQFKMDQAVLNLTY